jgi:hypothetical protein
MKLTDKTYSEFPVKIFEIVLTTLFIGSFLTILTAMAEAEFELMTLPWRAIILIFGPSYLVWTYKIMLEEKELLSKPFVRYLIYLISVSAIFLSLAQLQEIIPILKERISSYTEFGIKYSEKSFFHPLLTVIILFSFLVLYWLAYNEKRQREKRFTNYNYVFVATFTFIVVISMFLLPYSLLVCFTKWLSSLPTLESCITRILIAFGFLALGKILTNIFHSIAEKISSNKMLRTLYKSKK